jgi:hypothetical protein
VSQYISDDLGPPNEKPKVDHLNGATEKRAVDQVKSFRITCNIFETQSIQHVFHKKSEKYDLKRMSSQITRQ